MTRSAIVLSSLGLERGASISENDFAFIGNGFQIRCTKFQAAYISPRVHLLLQETKSINSFFLDCKTAGIDAKRITEFFERLMNGQSIDPTHPEIDAFLDLANYLENTELANKFIDDDNPIEISNVSSLLKNKSAIGRPIDSEIEFAASHFYEIDVDTLKELDVSLLERIISCPSLRLRDEDSLLEFICSLECDQPILLRYLYSDFLSCESISVLVNHLSPDTLDSLIWSSLCRRLLLPVSHVRHEHSSLARARFVIDRSRLPFLEGALGEIECPLKGDKSRDGIIAYLTKQHGGNVHDEEVVTITSKSVYGDDPYQDLKNVADLTSDAYFESKNETGQWVCWDFRALRVLPTHYTIRSLRLKSWVVERSLDGQNWTEIDVQVGNQDFKYDWNTASFALSNSGECRFIRLTQTDKNHYGDDELRLRALEFFGTLVA
jgi:hypothetical protein